MAQTTPLMKQFLEIKKNHPDAILFFRVGDFYEMFFDDAVKAASILQITLTSRDKNKKDAVPLCGIPYHAAPAYIAKLIRAGESVAVCEQVEDPAQAKGLVRREVVRVITPGTVIDPELLSAKENNYLAALTWPQGKNMEEAKTLGLACLDISTGDFRALASDASWQDVEGELVKLAPKEILLPSYYKNREHYIAGLRGPWPIRFVSSDTFSEEGASAALRSHFEIDNLAALGCGPFSMQAAGAILDHLQENQKTVLGNIARLRPIQSERFMRVGPLALRHLDLIPKSRDQKEGTLFHLLDYTMTAMGGRLLKDWILRPLRLPVEIRARQEGVDFFFKSLSMRMTMQKHLKAIADLERLIGRISLKAAQPRDLLALKESIGVLPEIQKALRYPERMGEDEALPKIVASLLEDWDNLEALYRLIDEAIVADPPFTLKEGGVIKMGYLNALDELRRFQKEGRGMLAEIERTERRATGIESLKVRYNQVFGYYIEVSGAQVNKVPETYIRKQTLTRSERFTTLALKEIEEKLSGSSEAIAALEASVFEEIRQRLSEKTAQVQAMAFKIATLDLLSALAECAYRNNYCKPEVNDDLKIKIIEGRHPVLEQGALGVKGGFIPNDVLIDPPSDRLLILTGPNMAGKSTYMRQIALIVLMAQMGGFVPAQAAQIGVTDQIFTRVGAQDALNEGMSTFMVEMTEMSQILRHATEKSLILLDEIGRGTSTFDGLSIAWAIAEFVHTQLKARTLFATHYHELTGLASICEGVKNYHVLVREWGEEIVFLRKMVAGGSDKSYGIQVGRLAGLPSEIIQRAKAVLKALEENAIGSPLHHHLGSERPEDGAEQGDLFSAPRTQTPEEIVYHPLVEALKKIDPNHLTPLQALQLLAELSEEAHRSDPTSKEA